MSANETQQLFHEYFAEWIALYKQGAVRPVTYQKYLLTLKHLTQLAPTLKMSEFNKRSYQSLLNAFAETHEKQTTMDFHHHLKGAVLDAIDEGVLTSDPTRKVIVKGKTPTLKKPKCLNQCELSALLRSLTLPQATNWDWFFLLVAKTGLRFSEALSLTPQDFDFVQKSIKIARTWDYKSVSGGFSETKNTSSKRTISLDSRLCQQFAGITKATPPDELIFVKGRVYNSTVNNRLKALCEKANVPVISVHGLRHTHASLLIYAGVSIASIAKRLGHSSIKTTQETYLHIIRELENQDNDKIMQHLATLD
jgi:integrase